MIIVVSGFFDPIGSQHIKLLKAAKEIDPLGSLIVGVNSDEASARKKGQPSFMSLQDRMDIVSSLKFVDLTLSFEDSDGSAKNLIRDVIARYPNEHIVFANGGDRHPDGVPIPEESLKEEFPNLEFRYGVGGYTKTGASSDLLNRWVVNSLKRVRDLFVKGK
jgi:cytidyltransferase-like protein